MLVLYTTQITGDNWDGTAVLVGISEADMAEQLASYCRAHWSDVTDFYEMQDDGQEAPNLDTLNDIKLVQEYFRVITYEGYETHTHHVSFADLAKIPGAIVMGDSILLTPRPN